MTIQTQLTTSRGSTIDIVSDNPKTVAHFDHSGSFANFIVTQINTDRFYDSILKDKDNLTILDIGSNIGLFSLYIHDRASVVYAIEPTPAHLEVLIDITKSYTNIIPLGIALYDKDTEIDFYTMEQNSAMNTFIKRSEFGYNDKITVQAKTIATILKDLNLNHVDLVKCDIEGGEMIALTVDTIRPVFNLINTWIIEIHQTDTGSLPENREKIKSIFESVGYAVEYHRPDSIICYHADNR